MLYPSPSMVNTPRGIVVFSVATAFGFSLLVFSLVAVVIIIYVVVKYKRRKRKWQAKMHVTIHKGM